MSTAPSIALNPLQFMASADGWLDPGLAPPLPERLAVIAAHGFTAVQTEIPEDLTPERYRAVLSEAGIRPGPGYLTVRLEEDSAGRDAWIERVRRTAARNAEAGSALSFLSLGMTRDAPRVAVAAAVGHDSRADRLAEVVDLLGRAATAAREEGVVPALHPHVGTWVETEEETREVLRAIPADVLAFGPDTGHLTWAGADTAALLREHAGRIAGIHVKDLFLATAAEARRDRLPYRETVTRPLWTEPGTGDADLDGQLDALGPDYAGWIVIEVDRGNRPTPEESIGECGRWVREALLPRTRR